MSSVIKSIKTQVPGNLVKEAVSVRAFFTAHLKDKKLEFFWLTNLKLKLTKLKNDFSDFDEINVKNDEIEIKTLYIRCKHNHTHCAICFS